MPIIKSAKKRVKTAKKATVRNAKTKKGLRSALKAFHGKITSGSHKKAQSSLDKAVKKGVMSKNKASRRKSQLAKAAKAAGVKHVAGAKKAAKPVAKKAAPAKKATAKPVAKKAPAKKPAAKKAPAKKPAAKKK